MHRAALALCFALFATSASAQQTSPRQLSLDDFANMLRPGGPTWQGRAAFPATPGAVARLFPGAHAAGDVIAEIDVTPSRTARLLEAITLTDPAHGERTLPAGTTFIGLNSEQGEAYPGRPVVITTNGPLQWCMFDDAAPPLCITMRSTDTASYREMNTPARTWTAPAPSLQEEVIATPLTWRIVIHEIDRARGVSFRSTIGHGAQTLHERGYGFIASGTGADLTERYPDLRFSVRVQGERVVVD